jgi:UDP-N-acetylglucosamine--N-acetylmuramyl-(pentapeptide) pyrophosphoryl-undecaprenol N-acetylglucosamine transferase
MKVVLTGGGTGGHVYPALAVAAQLVGDDVLYIGDPRALEARVAPAAGLRFAGIPSAQVNRRGAAGALKGAARIVASLPRAAALLRRERADATLATGGYACVPVAMASRWLGVPLIVFEPNARPGRANLRLGRFAAAVAVGLDAARAYFPAARVTGVPVSGRIGSVPRIPAREAFGLPVEGFCILVFGGSRGARSINQAIEAALPDLPGDTSVLHQTGRGAPVAATPGQPGYVRREYIDDMAAAYAAADLAICRSGAQTLAELSAAGLPAVLVPYPYAADDHQRANARAHVAEGAAVMLEDSTLTGPVLVEAVRELRSTDTTLSTMGSAAASQARPRAAEEIAALIRDVARGRAPDAGTASAASRRVEAK